MSNMSHCRFRNTLEDLTDCGDEIMGSFESGELMELSREERAAALALVVKMMEITNFLQENYGAIKKRGDVDITAMADEVDLHS